jgi:predicted amidohydrolase
MRFQVACAQFAPEKANVQKNLDKVAEITRQATSEGVELIVFPETILSGYFLEGGVLECALTETNLLQAIHDRLSDLSRPIDIALGYYEEREELLYNSAAYLEVGAGKSRVVANYQKFFLPTYGVFDEERFVSAGSSLCVFDSRLGRMALLICEDIWHSIMPTLCAVQGAQMILVPSASPARGFQGEIPSNLDRYDRLLRGIAEEHALYCINSALLGFEGGKGFGGGSSIVDMEGRVIGKAPILEEHMIISEIDLDLLSVSRSRAPLLGDLRTRWAALQRIISRD